MITDDCAVVVLQKEMEVDIAQALNMHKSN